MTSQDDLTLLKQMYQRGEITDEEYDVLRRHVLWGTPLPELMDEPPGAPIPAPRPPTSRPPATGPPGGTGWPAGRPAGPPPAGDPAAPWAGRDPADPRAGRAPTGRTPPGPPPVRGPASPAALPPPPRTQTGPAAGRAPGAPPAARGPASPAALPPPARPQTGPAAGRIAGVPPARGPAGSPPVPRYDPDPRGFPPSDPRGVPAPRPAPPDQPAEPPGRAAHRRHARQPDTATRDKGRRRPAPTTDPRGLPAPGRDVGPDTPPGRAAGARTVPGWESGPAAGPSWQNAAGTGTAAGTAAGSGYWSGTGQQPAAYDEPPSGDFRSVTGQRRTATAPADRSEQAKPARRRRGPRLVVVIMSLLLAAGLTAAGVWWFTFRGDPGVEPAAYAQSVCTGVRDWQRDVDGQTVALRAKIAPLTDRTAVRAAVVAYYTSLAARTDDLQGALTGAGVPHATGGTDYSQDLIRAVTDQATALRDSATRAGRLDVSSESLFQISLNSLLTNANAAVQKVSDALAHPALGIPPELTTAMQADPTCAAYTG